jgi:transcriptional regulator with XRE-family HTH domain
MSNLTPEACRAARGILKWSVRDLAEHAGVAFSTVHLLEKGEPVRDATEKKLVEAFAQQDVLIIADGGTGAMLVVKSAN